MLIRALPPREEGDPHAAGPRVRLSCSTVQHAQLNPVNRNDHFESPARAAFWDCAADCFRGRVFLWSTLVPEF